MPDNVITRLSEEKVAVVNIDGAIFPTIEDEILGLTNYTAYVPFSKEIGNIIQKSKNPFKLKVDISSPMPLSEGEIERMKAHFLDTIKSYEGDLEMKKRLRIKGLKISTIIEICILIGIFYASMVSGYGVAVGIIRFIAEFVFWGGLIFIPSVIGPALGGLRYRKIQRGVERLDANLREIEVSVKTEEKMIQDILNEYSLLDDMKIYEKLGKYAEKAGYNIAKGFYEGLNKRLSPDESFITKYLPAGLRDSIKAMFDIRVEAPDFYSPIGDMAK